MCSGCEGAKCAEKKEKMSTSLTATKSTEALREDKSSRYQSLVQKKTNLEKRLNEKYEQLHQLCQKVSAAARANLPGIPPMTSYNFSSSYCTLNFLFF